MEIRMRSHPTSAPSGGAYGEPVSRFTKGQVVRYTPSGTKYLVICATFSGNVALIRLGGAPSGAADVQENAHLYTLCPPESVHITITAGE